MKEVLSYWQCSFIEVGWYIDVFKLVIISNVHICYLHSFTIR